MKKTALAILAALSMAGCTTNGVYDGGKTWTLIGGLAVGAYVASAGADSDSGGGEDCYWAIRGDESVWVCN